MSRYEVRIEGALRELRCKPDLHEDGRCTISALCDRAGRSVMPEEILEFWFGRPGSAVHGSVRKEWFRKNAAFDALICSRFSAAIEAALAGGFGAWTSPRGALARILLLDQFTRNGFRGTPRAFAGDALALSLAEEAVGRGADEQLIAVERWFMYLPFAHAESLPAQQRSLELFQRLRDTT